MKKVLAIALAATAFTAFATVDGRAQTTTDRPATRDADRKTDTTRSADKRPAFKMDQELWESKQLIGTRVKSGEGKDIGEIDQLLVDPKDGKIAHAVVGIGGIAGIGEQKVVVKWSDLKVAMDPGQKKPVATVSQTALDSAPRYDRRAATVDRDKSPAASPGTSPDKK
jgi:sporulation protein YlmC with PRC-barrel domain